MNVLAIDSSAKISSVAVLRGGQTLAISTTETAASAQPELPTGEGASVKRPGAAALLTPMVQSAIEQSGILPNDLQLIALTVGPGMFTGLRVALVTAKAMAYASGADVIGVNTLEVLAAKAAAQSSHSGRIQIAINAQRKQLFAGEYRSNGPWRVTADRKNSIQDQQAWVNGLADGDLVSGSGIRLVSQAVESVVGEHPGIQLAAEPDWACDAESVGRVAIEHYKTGRRDDPWKLKPLYFRPSAAEEVRQARLGLNEA